MIMLAGGFCNAIREAKHEAPLPLFSLCRGAREGIELTGRFIDADHLVNAIRESACDCIFEYPGTLCGRALDDEYVACQRMNRERADVRHTAARALICAAAPFVSGLLGFVGNSLSQRVK